MFGFLSVFLLCCTAILLPPILSKFPVSIVLRLPDLKQPSQQEPVKDLPEDLQREIQRQNEQYFSAVQAINEYMSGGKEK